MWVAVNTAHAHRVPSRKQSRNSQCVLPKQTGQVSADDTNISTHPLLVKVGQEGPIRRSQPLSLQSSPPNENDTVYKHTEIID